MDREGFSALIIGRAIGFGIEVFVATTGQSGEGVTMPDLHHRPLEGLITKFNLPSTQVHGDFPECRVQRDGSIEPYTACGARQKEPLPIGVLRKLTQLSGFLGEALRRRFASEWRCGLVDDIPSLAIAKIER